MKMDISEQRNVVQKVSQVWPKHDKVTIGYGSR